MSRRQTKFTSRFIATAPVGKHYGEYGLLLRVSPSGRRYFEQRYSLGGKRRQPGIGRYPVVTLADARSKALDNLREVACGRDVIAEKRQRNAPSFEAATRLALAEAAENWRDPDKVRAYIRAFERYVFPALGAIPVNLIETHHFADFLGEFSKDRKSLAHDLRSRFGTVTRWAVRRGYRCDDPAGYALRGAVPRRYKRGEERNHASVPHAQVGAVLADLYRADLFPSIKHWLEFVVLTAVRTGDARLARWEEIEWDKRRWIVPAPRTKTGREHPVPLSDAALDVLLRAWEFGGCDGYVFVSRRGKVHAKGRLSEVLVRLQAPGVPHGFRSSFKTWCEEEGIDWQLSEAALAHVVGNQTQKRYIRTPYFDRRAPVMQAWGEYVTAGKEAALAEFDAEPGSRGGRPA